MYLYALPCIYLYYTRMRVKVNRFYKSFYIYTRNLQFVHKLHSLNTNARGSSEAAHVRAACIIYLFIYLFIYLSIYFYFVCMRRAVPPCRVRGIFHRARRRGDVFQ